MADRAGRREREGKRPFLIEDCLLRFGEFVCSEAGESLLPHSQPMC